MKRFTVLAFCLISPVAVPIPVVDGQTNLPVVQNGSQVAANGRFHATSMRPNSPVAQNIARGPVTYGPRTNNAYAPRIASQEAVNLRPNYSHFMQPLSPTLAAMSARHLARPDNVQPNRDVLPRSEIVQTALPITNPQRVVRTDNLQQTGRNRFSYSDALRRNRHEWHDRNWWRQHCNTIVFVSGGYYFLDGSYWYPAWGYDPLYNYYDYDGPIYTYGNLLPDEVIANVQVALQDAGYYDGPVTGSLNVETRAALANFQRDQGLFITGAIDEPTIESLGLY